MATRHKSEKSVANLDYWGVSYYESRDGILSSGWENVFNKIIQRFIMLKYLLLPRIFFFQDSKI